MASVIVPHRHGNRNGNNGSRREVRLQSCRMKGFPFGLFLQPPCFLSALYYIVLEFDLFGRGRGKGYAAGEGCSGEKLLPVKEKEDVATIWRWGGARAHVWLPALSGNRSRSSTVCDRISIITVCHSPFDHAHDPNRLQTTNTLTPQHPYPKRQLPPTPTGTTQPFHSPYLFFFLALFSFASTCVHESFLCL